MKTLLFELFEERRLRIQTMTMLKKILLTICVIALIGGGAVVAFGQNAGAATDAGPPPTFVMPDVPSAQQAYSSGGYATSYAGTMSSASTEFANVALLVGGLLCPRAANERACQADFASIALEIHWTAWLADRESTLRAANDEDSAKRLAAQIQAHIDRVGEALEAAKAKYAATR